MLAPPNPARAARGRTTTTKCSTKIGIPSAASCGRMRRRERRLGSGPSFEGMDRSSQQIGLRGNARGSDGGFQGGVACAPLASPISFNAAAWKMTFQLRLVDETGHCRWGRTCIRSGHGCIGQVANGARCCPNIRRRTALVRLRKRPVPAKSGRRATTLTSARS
jgi:hypothetical protein